MLDTNSLSTDKNYRVTYRSPVERRDRVMIAGYLDFISLDGITVWDARPDAGTIKLPWQWITAIWESKQRRHGPEILRGETRVY
jgi:hypothetical protein